MDKPAIEFAPAIVAAIVRFRRVEDLRLLISDRLRDLVAVERDGYPGGPHWLQVSVDPGGEDTFRGIPCVHPAADGFWWVLIGAGAILAHGPVMDEEGLSYLETGHFRLGYRMLAPGRGALSVEHR